MKYSAVIPVYNESGNLRELYNRLTNVLKRTGESYEIIFVNDGSTDNSHDILEGIASFDDNIVVIEFEKNFGQHPALTAGFRYAAGDLVITLDADLQNPPEEIPRLLKEIDKGYDHVCGKRKRRKDPLLRKIPSFFVNLIISMRTGVWMEDYGSMLRVFRRETARKVADEFSRTRAYITMIVPGVTRNIKEIEVDHGERYQGQSKYDIKKLMDAFFRIFFKSSPVQRSGKEDVQPVYTIKYMIRCGTRITPSGI